MDVGPAVPAINDQIQARQRTRAQRPDRGFVRRDFVKQSARVFAPHVLDGHVGDGQRAQLHFVGCRFVLGGDDEGQGPNFA